MRSKIDFPAALHKPRDKRTMAEDLSPLAPSHFLSRLQFINLVSTSFSPPFVASVGLRQSHKKIQTKKFSHL